MSSCVTIWHFSVSIVLSLQSVTSGGFGMTFIYVAAFYFVDNVICIWNLITKIL